MTAVTTRVGLAFALAVAVASVASISSGCSEPLEGQARIAAQADQTTRQLVAGLNARNASVLRSLIVLTSTAGVIRAPSTQEIATLMSPELPVKVLGAGEPGTMRIQDGQGKTQTLRLIEHGGDLKVLASSEPLASYLTRAGQTVDAKSTEGLRVLTIAVK
ncbi:MAG: hypothetical protein IPK13_07515 [Deltaproteobacteria bacterium]|nr:hypothetical protein [Deltaproteobacteria bacterium]